MQIRSVLKPESSVMASLAIAGSVYAIYQLNCGNVVNAHATDANHPALQSSCKKAGLYSFTLVSALTLITRDGNVAVIGFASIVGMEIIYKSAIAANPQTGQIEAPDANAYQNAGSNVIPMGASA